MTSTPALRLKLPYATEEEFLAKLGASIAKGSMFVATRTPKPVGSVFAFEFVLADGRKIFGGEGKVSAVSPDPARPGMTLAFRVLDPQSQELVARVCASREARPPPPAAPDPAAEERRRRRQAILEGPPPSPPPPGREPIIGIDLGTTNCRAAVFLDGEVKQLPLEGRNLSLPSVVAFDEKGRLLVGARAKAQILVDPRSAIFGSKRLVGRRAKSRKVREMAARFPYEFAADSHGDVAVSVQGKVLTIPQLTSFLLAEIRNRAGEALGCPVRRAVIGVPAYFNDRQRLAVRYAGQLGGLEVQRVLSEPTAVAIAFGFGKGLTRKRLLVYDLGGGTFDASVLEATGNELEVAGAGGDNFLGGLDFDARVANWLAERFAQIQQFPLPEDPLTLQRVRDAAETAKMTLSDRTETRVLLPFVATRHGNPVDLDVTLDRAHFEALTRDLVERSLEVTRTVFEASQIPPTAIDEVLIVGGQSQSPAVRQALEAFVGKPARTDLDPFASVAIGAALVGRALLEDEGATSFSLKYEEILTLPIGVASAGGAFDAVLAKGTRLPCEKVVSWPVDERGNLVLFVYQGESPVTAENEFLGKLLLETRANREAAVTFSVSRDGILTISSVGVDGHPHGVRLLTADTPEEVRAAMATHRSAPPQRNSPSTPAAAPAIAPEKKEGLISRFFKKPQ